MLTNPNQRTAKLYLTSKTLNLRKEHPTLFQRGEYVPLAASGHHPNHIIAFARHHEGSTAIVAVPRFCAALMSDNRDTICDNEAWGDTALEIPDFKAPCYHDVFTGACIPAGNGMQQVPVSTLFRQFPVALWRSETLFPRLSPASSFVF